MDQRSSSKWAGTDVDRDQAYGKAMGHEQGTIREDVGPAGPGIEQPEQGGLSTSDIAGDHPSTSKASQAPATPAKAGQLGQREEEQTPLFTESEAEGFRNRWQTLQTSFVDDPRNTVQGADELVAQVMQRLAQTFSDERKELEGQWQRGSDVSTEDLRLALQRYRSFFSRLLAV